MSSRIGKQAPISSCIQELREAVSQLLDANKIPSQIEEAKTTQSELSLKVQIFKDKGIAEKLNKQAAYTIDQTKMESAKSRIERVIKANIPVLGDAERILVVDYQDTRIDISQGNIDLRDTHKQIVDIMEGGKDAFEKRQLIYESWR